MTINFYTQKARKWRLQISTITDGMNVLLVSTSSLTAGRLLSIKTKMNMENQVTSIEQSERLLEVGVPAEMASLVWTTVDDNKTVVERDLCLPENIEGYAFTVADLIDIIGEPEGYAFYVTKWDAGEDYAVELAGDNPLFFRNKRLIDSAFQMVERLYEEGRIE